jgi:hypothetical protein
VKSILRKLGRSRLALIIGALVLIGAGGVAILSQTASDGDGRPASDTEALSSSASPTAGTPPATPTASPSASASATPSASASASPSARSESASQADNYKEVCAPYPAFPDANCTGWKHTGVKLKDCNGDIRKSGITLDGCRFNDLKIVAKNVTIKRSHVKGSVYASYMTDWDFQGLTLIDVEVEDAGNTSPDRAAIGGPNFTCIRCHVHNTGTGISMSDNVTIKESYVHDFTYTDGAHQAAAGANGGQNITLIHNNLECSRTNVSADKQGCSSALSLYDEPIIKNVLVQNNLFNTAGGYCTYGGGPNSSNVRYIDNQFGKKFHKTCGGYGPVAAWHKGNSGHVWRGNTWQGTKTAVNP